MRFLRLDLKAVGPFTGTRIVLNEAGGGPGLHLIVGPNEAGKSSALRALSYLLFGFPNEAPSARFVHEYPQLRVGGLLQGSRGDTLEIVRRKRKLAQESLVTADETAAVPESRLQEMLGRIEQSTFENLLAIDHARLRQGGDQIKAGNGEFAGLLFAAGAGLSGLRTAQTLLEKQRKELYVDRGRNPRINAAIQEVKEAQEALKNLSLSTDEWRRHHDALNEATARRRQLDARIDEIQRESRRAQRLRDAIPVHVGLGRVAEELAALGDPPRLRADFGEDVRVSTQARRDAQVIIERSEDRLRQFAEQIDQLPEPSAWLADAAAIDALQKELGAIDKADEDRPRLQEFLRNDERAARGLLRDLGRPIDLDAAHSLLLRADEPTAIRAVAAERTEQTTRADEARKTIRRHERQVSEIDSQSDDEPQPTDVGPIRQAVRAAQKSGDVDADRSAALAKRESARRTADRALGRLLGWSGNAQTLRDLPVPLDAKITEFADEFQQLADRGRHDDQERRRIEAERRKTEAILRALTLRDGVPTEADLNQSRADRDHRWRTIRQSWLDEQPIDRNGREANADELDRALERADGLADRLRREAEAVARKTDALAELEQLERTGSELERQALVHAEEAGRLAERWNAITRAIGLDGGSPAETREWLGLRDRALVAIDAAEQADRDYELIDGRRTARITDLRAALEPHVDDVGTSGQSLNDLLQRAEAALDQADSLARVRRDQANRRQTARNEIESAEITLQTAEERLGRLDEQWRDWTSRLGLEPNARHEQAEVFLQALEDLKRLLGQIRSHRSRLDGMTRGDDAFAHHARALAVRLLDDHDPATTTPAHVARTLAQGLAKARERDQKRVTLIEERDREAGRLESARDQLATADARIRGLAEEAGTESTADLLEIERRSIRRAELERRRHDLDSQIRGFAAGRDLSEFQENLRAADPDELASRIDEMERRIQQLQDERDTVQRTLGAEQTELDRMRGGDDGPLAAERVQELVARSRSDVERYVTIRLAELVLQRGIERYRNQNQDPVLQRAGAIFRTLTDHSFDGLQLEEDGGQTILQGIRPGGKRIGVEAMSDGTHDQLYLALRLAVLESWLATREPLPLILDDVLLTFDDRRAAAALRALAEFSAKTQVLMFTHHDHLIDLATRTLSPERLSIQRLPRADALVNLSSGG